MHNNKIQIKTNTIYKKTHIKTRHDEEKSSEKSAYLPPFRWCSHVFWWCVFFLCYCFVVVVSYVCAYHSVHSIWIFVFLTTFWLLKQHIQTQTHTLNALNGFKYHVPPPIELYGTNTRMSKQVFECEFVVLPYAMFRSLLESFIIMAFHLSSTVLCKYTHTYTYRVEQCTVLFPICIVLCLFAIVEVVVIVVVANPFKRNTKTDLSHKVYDECVSARK